MPRGPLGQLRTVLGGVVLLTAALLTLAPAASATTIYARRSGTALRMDVYGAGRSSNGRIVVLLHGGGWWSGSRTDMRPLAQRLVQSGFIVAVPDFRLACGTRRAPRWVLGFPFTGSSPLCGWHLADQVADVRAATAYVQLHARRLGGDPRRVSLMGSSSGGNVALLVVLRSPRLRSVRAVVNWSGAPSTAYIDTERAPFEGSLRPALTNAVGCPRAACAQQWAAASPLDVLGSTPAPRLAVLDMSSARERQVPEPVMEQFHRQLNRLHMRNFLITARGTCHSTSCADAGVLRGPPGATVYSQTVSFLRLTS